MQQDKISTDWIIYVAVWFFLGSFGVHRFISGKIGSGVGMLALTVFGWITIIVLFGFLLLGIVWLWWIVDGITIFMGNFEDKDGQKISFRKKIS